MVKGIYTLVGSTTRAANYKANMLELYLARSRHNGITRHISVHILIVFQFSTVRVLFAEALYERFFLTESV